MSTIILPIPVADPTRPRPLSSISTSELVGSSKPLPSLPPQPDYVPSARRSSTSRASLAPGSLRSVLQEPRILTRLLRYVRWHDFQSLALTCRACSNVLHHPELRDAVLSRFVPGYRYCLRHADSDTISSSIDVEFSDLSHFMISQHLPLNHYPTLALTTLSSSVIPPALKEKIRRLVMLCQAHSRMILLLQALIHSASSSVGEELDDPSLRYRNSAQQGGRELVFPAPLSFTPTDGGSKANAANPRRGHLRFFSMPSVTVHAPRPMKVDTPRRSSSVMSMLRRSTVPPPPPEADPLSLKIYAGSWRGRRRMSTTPIQTFEYGEKVSRQPKLVSTPESSGSSTIDSPVLRSTRQSEILPITITMPHDIRAATCRLRAPILRVFFPCSKVDHRTITACEAQLDDAGLWQHLSVGDIVCNLGYLPPSDGVGPSGSDKSFDDSSSPESWMIFDGTVLVPYTPSAILPISEPLLLPSPFYYAHITPPPVNPRFIATLPREKPELSLVLLPTRVPSPHSPNGFARIKKYLWLAHLRPHVRPGLGEGWHGEWILEGEGTKEGRQSLLDALSGYVNVKREWKLVMERSTSTRIWLRLMSPSPSKDIELI